MHSALTAGFVCAPQVSVFIIRSIHKTPGVPDHEVPTVVRARLCMAHRLTSCNNTFFFLCILQPQNFLVGFLTALFRVEQIETPCCVLLYIYLRRLQASTMVG